jgi:DNA (cytosine-5)-methyltransferase 1
MPDRGKRVPRLKQIPLIDLFCGAGGMTLGFTRSFGHPFVPVWANDIDDEAVATYNRNFGNHCVGGDIVDILEDKSLRLPVADVVIGGPPCQGFSLLNRQREGDPRKQLWRPFLDIVKKAEAKVFVMENVPPLINSTECGLIVGTAEQMGFTLAWDILCAADYGVPQLRWRAFIVGSRIGDPWEVFPPARTHVSLNGSAQRRAYKSKSFDDDHVIENPSSWATVRDAIGDLGRPEGTEVRDLPGPHDLHFGRNPTELSKKRYRTIPHEGMNRFDLQKRRKDLTPKCWINKKSGGTDLFGRMWWDRPACTIRTEFFKPEKGRYLHPKQHRPMTHREAARFQSFPDGFKFEGRKQSIAKQIGNAVPPLLAARVADSVLALLRSNQTNDA